MPRAYPALARNPGVIMNSTINAIRVVLNGGFAPGTAGNPRPYGMPPFAQQLNDEDIASVLTFVRNSWGNRAPAVAPADVQRYRRCRSTTDRGRAGCPRTASAPAAGKKLR